MYKKLSILISIFLFTISLNASDKNISLTKDEQGFIKQNPVIKVAGEMDWPPFDFVHNGEYQGIAKDYLVLLEKYTGLKFDIKIGYTWSELLAMGKNKELDLMPVIYYTKERESYFNFTDKYITIRNYLYTSINAEEFKSFNELNGKTIATPKGFAQVDLIKEKYPEINILEVKSPLECIDAVITKKADAFIENIALVSYLLKEHNIKGIKTAFATDLGVNSIYMAARKDQPLLKSIIQKGLDAISSEEKLAIHKKWMKIENATKSLSLTKDEKEFIKSYKVKCITTNSWAPFNTHKGDDETPIGIAIDYWNIILKNTGLNASCEIAPKWTDVLSAIKNKEADITLSTTATKDRRKYALFSKPYASFPIAIATSIDSDYISQISYLEGKRVAVGKNFSAHKMLKEHYPAIEFVPVKNVDEALKLLSHGKVFAVAEILPVLAYKMNRFGYSNLKISGATKFNFDVMMMINNDKPQLVSIINKGIDTISEDDKKLIYNKWISVKFQKGTDYSLIWQVTLFFGIILLFFLYRQRQLKSYNKDMEIKNKELQKTKQSLKESLEGFETLLNSTLEGIFIFEKGICIDVNNIAVELLKYKDKDEMIGKSVLEFVAPESLKTVKEHFSKDDISPYEGYILKNDGEEFPALIRGRNIILNGKEVRLSALIDISNLKHKENIILEQSKMAALGEMLGNIAHQWRQPLNVISTGATGLKVSKEFGSLTDELFIESCTMIQNNAQYLSKTIDDFRNFIKGERKIEQFNLNDTIKSFHSIVEASLKSNRIKIIMNIPDNISMKGYPNELIQCFINICNNSIDALESIEDEDKYFFINIRKKGEDIKIDFKDNAGGIPDDIIDKIFEPYFTTKHKSQGTGLGLHMVYNLIVNGMEGKITAKNTTYTYNDKEYKGARFKITLKSL